MRILVISQYFWPENFKINDICLGLQEKGHQVEVLTGIPNYPTGKFAPGYCFFKNNDEVWNGIPIHRSKLLPRGLGGFRLMLNYFSFALFATLKGLTFQKRFDRILVYEPSPITVGIPAVFTARKLKIPYFFWVQDLWPESLTAAGNINNQAVLKFFDSLTRWIYRNAEKVLVQSIGFKNYIINQEISPNKIIFYPNTTEDFYEPKAAEVQYKERFPEGFVITFAGNLGEAQSLQTLLHAAKIMKEKGISEVKWVILGEGRQRNILETYIENNQLSDTVFLLGSFPGTDMPSFYACSDVLVASLKKENIFELTIPSKIQSYLACAKPILASLDGEGARIVEESGAGLSSPAEDAELLALQAEKMFRMNGEQREEMGKNAIKYFKKEFERDMLLEKLVTILQNR